MVEMVGSVELMEQTDRLAAKRVSLEAICFLDSLQFKGVREVRNGKLGTSHS